MTWPASGGAQGTGALSRRPGAPAERGVSLWELQAVGTALHKAWEMQEEAEVTGAGYGRVAQSAALYWGATGEFEQWRVLSRCVFIGFSFFWLELGLER